MPAKLSKHQLTKKIYSTQITSSRWRDHPLPAYTHQELTAWLNSQPKFDRLYNEWVRSGFIKSLVPSIDRTDDNLPYTFDNIKLMTWEENYRKGCVTRCKAVDQYTKSGALIGSYKSMGEAAKAIGLKSIGGISSCCLGYSKHCKGFIWQYAK